MTDENRSGYPQENTWKGTLMGRSTTTKDAHAGLIHERFGRLLTVGEAAAALQRNDRFIRDLLRSGELKAHSVGGLIRVAESALLEYLEQHPYVVSPGRSRTGGRRPTKNGGGS